MKDAAPTLADLFAVLEEAPRVYSEFEAMRDLVKRAQRRERGVRVDGKPFTLERGELLVSERALMKRWQWTRDHVRKFLRQRGQEGHLLSTRIARLAGGSATKLTIVGFDTYAKSPTKGNQGSDQPKSSPRKELAPAPDHARNQRPPHTPTGGSSQVGQRSLTTPIPSTPRARDVETGVENPGKGSRERSPDPTAPGNTPGIPAPHRSRDVQRALVEALRSRGVDVRPEVKLHATSDASRSGWFWADVGVYRGGQLVALAECKTSQEKLGGYRQRTNYEGAGVPYRVATRETWVAVADWLAAVVENSAGPQLEIPPAESSEHLRYAEELSDAINQGQEGNGLVDRDTYRPVRPWHPKTLEAALAIKNAGVPLLVATQYARSQATQFKPGRHSQIGSVAYVLEGCIRHWHAIEARRRAQAQAERHAEQLLHHAPPPQERAKIRAPIALGDVLAGLLPSARGGAG